MFVIALWLSQVPLKSKMYIPFTDAQHPSQICTINSDILPSVLEMQHESFFPQVFLIKMFCWVLEW